MLPGIQTQPLELSVKQGEACNMKKIPTKYYIYGGIAVAGIGYFIYDKWNKKQIYTAIMTALSTGGNASSGTGATGTITDWKNDPTFASTMIPSGGSKTIILTPDNLEKGIEAVYNSMNTTIGLSLFNNPSDVLATVKQYALSQQQFSQLSAAFFGKYNQTLYDFLATNSTTLQNVTNYLKTIPKYQTA